MNQTVLLLGMITAAMSSALMTIVAYYRRPPRLWLVYVAKPLATLLILAIVVMPGERPWTPYSIGIAAGLLFSLAGDVWLMLPTDRFLPGLASFLLAHLCYVFAFSRQALPAEALWPIIPLAMVGLGMLRYLWPGLSPRLRMLVSLYSLAIVAMAGLAASRALAGPSTGAWLAVAGALLFVGSDAVLAIDRYRRQFHWARAIVLGTYFSGQLLIAVSARLVEDFAA